MHLVIVDDDSVLLGALARRFGQRGFSVTTYADAITAELLIAQQAQAYLLDLRFASQSGLSFIAPLRAALPQSRIVLLTGYASIANAVQAVKLGADDYLTKPVDFLQLEQAITGKAQSSTTADIAVLLSPEQLEWEHIHRVLAEHGGNISRTAELLGMHRRTLQRKLNKHRP
ncbi:response regulator transcription factor [Rheinheimera hassiensis]|uniref:response regulator transcription factor n=1 Tax=Rheinheimera hassiensis TaxID=1193627 RepID=UPI001F05E5CD|nr:response regulator [Rheinheimera hassiensis]